MSALVLNTHAALRWSVFPEKLSKNAASAMQEAEQLVFPAIVFWETSLLLRKRRIELPAMPSALVRS